MRNTSVASDSLMTLILFNIYIKDITNISNDAKFIVYADISIFLRWSDINTLSVVSNTTLKHLAEWSSVNSLKLNTAKTKAMLLTPPQRHIFNELWLELGSDGVELSPNLKTLGVVFNNHLTWSDHTEHVVWRKLSRLRYILYRV